MEAAEAGEVDCMRVLVKELGCSKDAQDKVRVQMLIYFCIAVIICAVLGSYMYFCLLPLNGLRYSALHNEHAKHMYRSLQALLLHIMLCIYRKVFQPSALPSRWDLIW